MLHTDAPSLLPMSVQDLLKEIAGVKRYMTSRSGGEYDCARDSLSSSFAKSLLKMILPCPCLGPHEAAMLTDALKDDSPYGVAGTKTIMEAIDKKVESGSSENLGRKGLLHKASC